MADDEEVKEFLSNCQNNYEQQMDKHFEGAESIAELTGFHRSIKIDLINRQLMSKWKEAMGPLPMPEDLKSKLTDRIDHTFRALKLHFQTKLDGGNNANKKSHSENEGVAIGIDLGTTMCCVAVMYKGKVKVVENVSQHNSRTTPSYVTYHKDGSDSFGLVAKQEAFKQPETTIYDAKRMIGRSWTDENLQRDRLNWPFEIVEVNGNPKIECWKKSRYPHEVSARLLTQFRKMAADHLHVGYDVIRKAVITVPAYFSEPQRRATHEAAECAGLQVLNILSEPTAAAIAYNWKGKQPGTRRTLIYDLGGGTFDVAIAIVSHNQVNILGVNGDSHLGGQDFDQILMEYCIEQFKSTTGIDLLANKNSDDKRDRDLARKSMARLRLQCETIKEMLSGATSSFVDIPCIVGSTDLSVEVTREKLNELCRPLVQKTLTIVDRALEDVASKGIRGTQDIDDILLIGGSTRMLLVREMVEDYFGKKPSIQINPDEAVAIGAAIQADMLRIKGNKTIKPRLSFREVEVKDVTPLTLSIECLGDRVSQLIHKNSKIPCDKEQVYTTSDDNQSSLRFTVLQGESTKASENITLGEFYFEGIPPSPAGQQQILVTMTIDSMGILQVKAVCLTTGKENAIKITSTQLGMKDAEIKLLKNELEEILRI